MSNMIQIGDQMFFHPGYYLQEWLEEKNMSVEEFADKTNNLKEAKTWKIVMENAVIARNLERQNALHHRNAWHLIIDPILSQNRKRNS